MNLSQIFRVFSKRHNPSDKVSNPITKEFRFRVLNLCIDSFKVNTEGETLLEELHSKLQYLHGRQFLSNVPGLPNYNRQQDVITFLGQCRDDHFLDFVELIFKSRCFKKPNVDDEYLVDSINQFLAEDDLPYHLTDFVFSPYRWIATGADRGYRASTLESYPQIIRRENELLEQATIEPTLILLAQPAFSQANKEFLEALADYRKGDYRDSVAKCGSSFESVMKIICDKKSWPYNQNDTASPLLKSILPRTNLDPFFEQPMILVATIRNRLSSSHGAGTQERLVPAHVANFVINATASSILLLVEETKP